MIADMLNNKKLNPIVTKWFIRDRKLNTSLALIIILLYSAKRYYTKTVHIILL